MKSIFPHFFLDNDQKQLQRFHKQVSQLNERKETEQNDCSFNEDQFLRQCAILQKQLDNYKRKIERVKILSGQQSKEDVLKDLETLNGQLSNLMTSGKISSASDSVKVIASKILRKEKIEERNDIERPVVKVSLHSSSSDPNCASDRSKFERHGRAPNVHLRKELRDDGEITSENCFIAVAQFQAQEKEDLSLKKNELIRVIATRQDGWWLAENANGDRGYVPKTFLKVFKGPSEFEETTKKSDKPLPIPRLRVATKTARTISARRIGNEDTDDKTKVFEVEKQKDMAMTAETSNSEQNVETKIFEESITEISKLQCLESMTLSAPEISKTVFPRPLTQSIIMRDTAERISDYNNHVTYECYLAPRLSKSNYAFHDIYWNYEDDRVSNVYTIKAHPSTRDPQTWIFPAPDEGIVKILKKDVPKTALNNQTFIIRSNYKQKSVMLCLEATIVFSNQKGEICEQSLGCVLLPIIDENGYCCLQNKNYTTKLFTHDSLSKEGVVPISTQIQINFRVSDVPNSIVHQVDSLPDIFLCQVQLLPMFYYYRRLLGQFLTKDSNNCSSSALKAEPFLATFPVIADQPDIMEMLWELWEIHGKNVINNKLSETKKAERFRSFFLTTGFILHQTSVMPKFNWADARCFADRQAKLHYFREQYLHNFDIIKYLSKERCHPIDIYRCAVDIAGPHAIN